jgi:hypothetical protein
MDDQENQNAKKQDYWLWGSTPTTNRLSTLSEENMEEAAKQSTETKPPPIIISVVTNIIIIIITLLNLAKVSE